MVCRFITEKTRREKTYTTVSTVRPPALLGSLVDLDVLDDEGTGVEALGVSVGLGVLEEAEEELGGLDGPAGLGDTKLLACMMRFSQLMLQHGSPEPSSLNARICSVFLRLKSNPFHLRFFPPLAVAICFANRSTVDLTNSLLISPEDEHIRANEGISG